jgi:DNA replication protein DnaC
LDAAWKDLSKKHGAVTLTGARGIGKSAWACRVLFLNRQGYFTSLIAMIREIRQTWDGIGSEKDVMDFYCETPILVVDEVGVQTRSENEKLLLYEILVNRYEYFRPTILTTNLDAGNPRGRKELIDCIGARVWDRIMGGWVDCSAWPRCRE